MWHKDDSINLNGSISFYEQAHANSAMKMIESLYDIILVAEHAVEAGKDLWVIDMTRTCVDPCFTNTLVSIGEKYSCEGTVTYVFNERLETGIWRNRDFIRLRPLDLYIFAEEKLGMIWDEISVQDYNKIKAGWLFQVWSRPHDH